MSGSLPDFPLVPYDLSRAPQLAALTLVEEALHVSVLSLVAEHPMLQQEPTPQDTGAVRRARRLLTAVSTFRRALSSYRGALYRALCPCPPADDAPLF